jgi:hypothetical protein
MPHECDATKGLRRRVWEYNPAQMTVPFAAVWAPGRLFEACRRAFSEDKELSIGGGLE